MNLFVCITCLLTNVPFLICNPITDVDLHQNTDVGLNISQIVIKYGYDFESHEVVTEDGYILSIHRIPYGKNSTTSTSLDRNRPVVLLMHGIFCSSVDWVNLGPQKALAFLLADLGYDVWMGNQRGNTYSTKHLRFDIEYDAKDFFNYSFEEIGLYDLPAIIDYILTMTKSTQLSYIGHSQGNTALFVLASERPAYNSKMKKAISLAPVAFMAHTKSSLLQTLSKRRFWIEWIFSKFHIYNVFAHSTILSTLSEMICGNKIGETVCAYMYLKLAGFDPAQLDESFLPVLLTNFPAGASLKQILHYLQGIQSGRFAKYDYGTKKNVEYYQSTSPPSYNLSNVQVPIVIHYSTNDMITSTEDVEYLATELPNLMGKKLVPFSNFTHCDFLWANNIVTLLNNDVINELE